MRSDKDKHVGLYSKFHVTRNDPTGKHAGCYYFVLDTDHDQFSVPALTAYADACELEFPKLASDLRGLLAALRVKHASQTPPAGIGSEVYRLRKVIDQARRITASDPKNIWCRQATILLNEALTGNSQRVPK